MSTSNNASVNGNDTPQSAILGTPNGAVNSTVAHQLTHRSIRKWRPEPLTDVLPTLLDVASATATSHNLQMASIIRITDTRLRARLAEIAYQSYLANAPELWIFIVDTLRNETIAAEEGKPAPAAESADGFFQGFTDAALMAQNVVNAAESMGLGTVYFGSILNDAEAVCELLKLPRLTFPVVGLGIGYPAQDPITKPRMPIAVRVSENEYTAPESWHEVLAEYDETLKDYYVRRNARLPRDGFTTNVVDAVKEEVERRFSLGEFARAQGFKL